MPRGWVAASWSNNHLGNKDNRQTITRREAGLLLSISSFKPSSLENINLAASAIRSNLPRTSKHPRTSYLLHAASMQRLPSRGKGNRPQPLQTKSFHRFSPSPEPPTSRSRSSTLPGLVASDLQRPSGTLGIGEQEPDPFDTNDEEIGSPMSESGPESPYPEGYDQLPTEIQSLLEKYYSLLKYFVTAAFLI